MIEKDSYEVPAIFRMMAREGKVEEKMMYNTYNMGLGMVLAVNPADADRTVVALAKAGEKAWTVGEVVAGEHEAVIV